VLAARAIYDAPTIVITLVTLGVLWRFQLPELLVVVAAAALGVVVWLLSQRG
jgi:hypothetical protein